MMRAFKRLVRICEELAGFKTTNHRRGTRLCGWMAIFFCSAASGSRAADAADWIAVSGASSNTQITCDGSRPDRLTISFELAGFQQTPRMIQGEIRQQIRVPGEPVLQDAGYPELPCLARSLQIPDNASVTVRLLDSERLDFPETPVAPSRGPIPRTVNPASVPYTFGAVYQTATPWPESVVSCSDPFILRDRRGVTLRLHPFQYVPLTHTLRVYTRMTIEVLLSSNRAANAQLPAIQRAESAAFQPVYASFFLNGPPDTAKRTDPLPDSGEHLLIVSATNYLAELEPFTRWKQQAGLRTTLVSREAAGGTAEGIKQFAKNVYETDGLTFLLLVGDADDIPTFTASDGASDPTYSKLAGNDDYPDIFVGRFSASSTQDVSVMVRRTIIYEQSPAPGGAWYRRAACIASDEEDGNGVKDREHMETIRTNLLANGYSAIDTIYDWSDEDPATADQVSNSVHAGRNLINYLGHGSDTYWVTTGFNNDDVFGLTNTTAWPFIFDVACVNGLFTDRTCFAEAWLRSAQDDAPAGALAIYASSISQSWDAPIDALRSFNHLLLEGGIHSFGGLCFNAALFMIENWGSEGVRMFNTWTVFGDPSVQVRTTEPATLAVTHPAALSNASFAVHVEGVPGAHISLTDGSTLYGTARADAQGDATILLDDYPPFDVLLTVTAANAIPYTQLIAAAKSALSVSPDSLTRHVITNSCIPVSITVSNAGEPFSVLPYTLSLIPNPVTNGPVDWFFLETESGSITGRASKEIAAVFSSTNQSPGEYNAYLRVTGPTNSIDLPIKMIATITNMVWTVEASASGPGAINPTGTIPVTNGESVVFHIQADALCFIQSFSVNGLESPGAAGLESLTSTGTPVFSNGGVVTAAFAVTADETAAHGTPFPWLRRFYEHEADLNALALRAEEDTDGDGFQGWQEYGAGTDPRNPASKLSMTLHEATGPGGDLIITWNAATDRAYRVETATGLTEPYTPATTTLTNPAGGLMSYTGRCEQSNSALFYRIQVQP